MKKVYILIAALCLALALLIGGSILVDKKLEDDTSFISDHIDFDKFDSSGSKNSFNASNNNKNIIGNNMEITEKEEKAVNISDISTDHEVIVTDIGEIKVDAILSTEEWNERTEKGFDKVSINDANKKCKGLYYYDNLQPGMRQLYLEIYLALSNYTDSFYICSVSPDDIDLAFNCVMGDHPEIFYVNGYLFTKYTSSDEIIKIEFTPGFTMEESKANEYKDYIKEYRDAFMKGISMSAGDYEKIKYTYEFVILNTEYNIESEENQNILSVLYNGESVCQGYAKAFQYLVSNLNIQSALVVGYVNDEEGHAWNLVRCNGLYYYVDCTWGDSSYSVNEDSLPGMGINYDYLNITTDELQKTHVIDNFALVPSCVSNKDNYYVKEGLYFTSVDAQQLSNAFENAKAGNKKNVELKCSSKSVFDNMGTYLLDENHVFDYLSSSTDSLTYMKNEKMLIYSFPTDI